MDALTELEDLYSRILEITRLQVACLEGGNLSGLAEPIARKQALLLATEPLLQDLRAAEPRDGAFQEGLRRLGVILEQLVQLEERCRALAPSPAPQAPAGQVARAYGKL